jgi:hypothetical protein
MARSIAVIKQQIIDAKNSDPVLSAKLLSSSQTSTWNLWAFITAVSINLHEQLWDIFKQEVEDIAAKVVPGTAEWLRARVFEFQYSSDPSNSQEISLIDFVPKYPVTDPALRIITSCSVIESGNRVLVKVAKKNGLVLGPLNDNEIGALRTYIGKIKFAGTNVAAASSEADRIQVIADVFYNGQYSLDVIKPRVFDSIKNYFSNLSFDGVVYIAKIQDAIQAVPGVVDVVVKNIVPRTNIQPPVAFNPASEFHNKYATSAGYVVPEDATTPPGLQLEQTITFSIV